MDQPERASISGRDDNLGAVFISFLLVAAVSCGFGFFVGRQYSQEAAATELKNSAVKAGRGIWKPGSNGDPVFHWTTDPAGPVVFAVEH